MFHVIIGQSEDPLAAVAIQEIVAQVASGLNGNAPLAGILWCSIDYEHQTILDGITAAFPTMALIGCTTDGEICSQLGFSDDSVILVVFASKAMEITSGCGGDVASDGRAAGREAACACLRDLTRHKNKAAFAVLLTDPLSAGISGVDAGIKDILGETFPVIGGVSAAHSKQRTTHQFFNNEVRTNSVVLLLFAGDLQFAVGIKGGHSALAARRTVTHAEKNVVYRIGDMTAYDYFRHHIGEYDLFMNYCLAIYPDGGDAFYVLSAPYSDADSGSVSLNGPLPPQAEVQLGTADKSNINKSCRESITTALNNFRGTKICAALFFSCAGRKMIMGTRIHEEYDIARQLLPDTPFAGFYCYGEFAPLLPETAFHFHGTTFVTLLIGY